MKSMKDKKPIYWTDKVAQEVKKRVENNPILQKVVKKKGYIVYDEKTPSGKIHIGSSRGWVLHDIIAKTMRDHGMKGHFILSSDDIDPFDGIPSGFDKEKWKKFMGIPLMNVPSPVKGYKSFAEYYFIQCVEKFEIFGIEAEIESTGQRYINGDFNEAIRIILNNADKIKDIYLKTYGKLPASDKLPFNPICEKCGKIGTTLAYEWDPEKEVVKYVCEPQLVDWAEGCGHRGEISPFNGGGKFPWKVEWAAKWPTVGVVCESAGKDHFTKGGSRTIAVEIACKVLNYPPPYPSTCEDIGKGYEFFLVHGKKMSTSKGLGVSFVEVLDMVRPELLRFLMVKSRPETTIDFTPEGNTIPLLFDEFDRTERIYFGLEDVDEKEKNNAKRVYELTLAGNIPKQKPFRIPFDFATMIAQLLSKEKRIKGTINILKKTGHLDRNLTKFEIQELKNRLDYAEKWAEEYAPKRLKIKIIENLTQEIISKLSDQQKNTLNMLGKFLEKDRKDAEIWDQIKKIADKNNIKPAKAFQAAYLVLLGKPYGPRLIPFIQSLDKEFLIKRFTVA
jgi:lysyl-tRNA synthetase class 1